MFFFQLFARCFLCFAATFVMPIATSVMLAGSRGCDFYNAADLDCDFYNEWPWEASGWDCDFYNELVFIIWIRNRTVLLCAGGV